MESRNRFQREPQSLEAWETWVDRLIVAAQERGDFDDLPGHGKPLRIEESPFAGGLDIGFGILKNAGVAPYWVELEKEIRAACEQLDAIAVRSATLASTAVATDRTTQTGAAGRDRPRRRWWRCGRFPARSDPRSDRSRDVTAMELARLRRAYLQQAAELDRLIAQYNAAIPRELWHLERRRLTQDAAALSFDRQVEQRSPRFTTPSVISETVIS